MLRLFVCLYRGKRRHRKTHTIICDHKNVIFMAFHFQSASKEKKHIIFIQSVSIVLFLLSLSYLWYIIIYLNRLIFGIFLALFSLAFSSYALPQQSASGINLRSVTIAKRKNQISSEEMKKTEIIHICTIRVRDENTI